MNCDKAIEKEFDKLIKNWKNMDSDYIQRFKVFKSRHLNLSGNQKERISYWKKVEMLKEAGVVEILVKKNRTKINS